MPFKIPALHVSHTLWTNELYRKYSYSAGKTAGSGRKTTPGVSRPRLRTNTDLLPVSFHQPKDVIRLRQS